MLGQTHHFRIYAPEKIEYAINRYTNETKRLYGVLDKRLKTANGFAASIPLRISPSAPGPSCGNGRARTSPRNSRM